VHTKELGKDHPLWEESARILAYGLHNTILHWSPERVALGGSMMNEIGIPLARVRFHLEAIRNKFPRIPDMVHGELKDQGGLWGALARLQQLTARS
jgi:predicted NBD/HSP70 family sugar kinase